MNKEVERQLRERLISRTERLLKLGRIKAVPKQVLAMMVEHVVYTALPLCGEELITLLLRRVLTASRMQHGICDFCGDEPVGDTPRICDKCVAQIEAEDREMEKYL